MSITPEVVAQDTDVILSYRGKHWHFGNYGVQKVPTVNQTGINKWNTNCTGKCEMREEERVLGLGANSELQ